MASLDGFLLIGGGGLRGDAAAVFAGASVCADAGGGDWAGSVAGISFAWVSGVSLGDNGLLIASARLPVLRGLGDWMALELELALESSIDEGRLVGDSRGAGEPLSSRIFLHASDFLYSMGSRLLGPTAFGLAPFLSSSSTMISLEAWCSGVQRSLLTVLTLAPCCMRMAVTSTLLSCGQRLSGVVRARAPDLDCTVQRRLALGIGYIHRHAGPQ